MRGGDGTFTGTGRCPGSRHVYVSIVFPVSPSRESRLERDDFCHINASSRLARDNCCFH